MVFNKARWLIGLAVTTGALAIVDGVSAHALLQSPKPRDDRDDYKDPNGPCGPVPRTNQRTVLSPGSQVTVRFGETIDHPGCFLLSYSKAGDQNFRLLPGGNVKHNPNGTATRQSPRPYTATVTLPNETCDDCTLQLVQVMLDSDNVQCPPAQFPVGSRYYSCADISLKAGGDGGVITVDGGAPPKTDAGTDAGSQGEPDASPDASPDEEDEEPEDALPDAGKKKKPTSGAQPGSGGGMQCSLGLGPEGASGIALLSSTLVLALAWARRRRR
jgi:hypothetical protein